MQRQRPTTAKQTNLWKNNCKLWWQQWQTVSWCVQRAGNKESSFRTRWPGRVSGNVTLRLSREGWVQSGRWGGESVSGSEVHTRSAAGFSPAVQTLSPIAMPPWKDKNAALGPGRTRKGWIGRRDAGTKRPDTTRSPCAQAHQPQERGRAANPRKPEGDGSRAGTARTSQSHGDTPGQSFEDFPAPRAVAWTAADRDQSSTDDHSNQPIITWFWPGM